MDDPVAAKVSLVSPALDPGSTTVEVWLRVDNRLGELKVGTSVHVRVTGRTAANALTIPDSALVSNTDGTYVMVVGPDGLAHKRVVSTGIRDSGNVQITSGLKEGDIVITAGAFTLEDGTKVKLNEDDKGQKDPKDEKGA